MKPGHSTSPSTSTVRRPGSESAPTAAMRSPTMPTSAAVAGAPEPSTTVAPRNRTSNISVPGQEGVDRRFDDGALEEARIGPRVDRAGVGEGKLGNGPPL